LLRKSDTATTERDLEVPPLYEQEITTVEKHQSSLLLDAVRRPKAADRRCIMFVERLNVGHQLPADFRVLGRFS
jgi:hypothetical protein